MFKGSVLYDTGDFRWFHLLFLWNQKQTYLSEMLSCMDSELTIMLDMMVTTLEAKVKLIRATFTSFVTTVTTFDSSTVESSLFVMSASWTATSAAFSISWMNWILIVLIHQPTTNDSFQEKTKRHLAKLQCLLCLCSSWGLADPRMMNNCLDWSCWEGEREKTFHLNTHAQGKREDWEDVLLHKPRHYIHNQYSSAVGLDCKVRLFKYFFLHTMS